VTPSAKREVLAVLVQEHGVPVRRACQAVRLSRAAYCRPPGSRLVRDAALVTALNEVVARHSRWSFWKCFYRLRRAGQRWNHKRVHRIYCALRLNLPRRTKRRVPVRLRQPLVAPARLNETWALDFMADALYDGRGFRTFNVLDEGNREALAIEVGTSIPSARVIRVLDDLIRLYGRPTRVRVDNGPSSRPRPLSTGARHSALRSATSSPGRPIRTPSSNDSIGASAKRSSTPISSTPSSRCARSPRPGSRSTTPSGPMTASARCGPWRFCRGQTRPQSLPLKCLLDGEAYGRTSLSAQAQTRVNPFDKTSNRTDSVMIDERTGPRPRGRLSLSTRAGIRPDPAPSRADGSTRTCAGRKRVDGNFDLQKNVGRLLQIYQIGKTNHLRAG
jgi:putative transposase